MLIRHGEFLNIFILINVCVCVCAHTCMPISWANDPVDQEVACSQSSYVMFLACRHDDKQALVQVMAWCHHPLWHHMVSPKASESLNQNVFDWIQWSCSQYLACRHAMAVWTRHSQYWRYQSQLIGVRQGRSIVGGSFLGNCRPIFSINIVVNLFIPAWLLLILTRF